MRSAQAFKLLGVNRGADRREVRRAYAALLKQIDPDQDVAGFLKLREALEAAENDIRWRAMQQAALEHEGAEAVEPGAETEAGVEPEAEVSAVEVASLGPVLPDESPPLAAQPLPDAPPLPRPVRPDFAELPPVLPQPDVTLPEGTVPESLVTVRLQPLGNPDRFAALRRRFAAGIGGGDETDAADAVALFEELLADPALAAIDARERFEGWLAELLHDAGPRADPVLPRAVEAFGWANELEAINPRWLQARVAQRADDLAVIARLEQPGHRWHVAYATLQEPAPDQISVTRRIALREQIEGLLASLRRHNPWVEDHFDPAHVRLWEQTMGVGSGVSLALFREGISPFGGLMLAYLAVQLVAWLGVL